MRDVRLEGQPTEQEQGSHRALFPVSPNTDDLVIDYAVLNTDHNALRLYIDELREKLSGAAIHPRRNDVEASQAHISASVEQTQGFL